MKHNKGSLSAVFPKDIRLLISLSGNCGISFIIVENGPNVAIIITTIVLKVAGQVGSAMSIGGICSILSAIGDF